MTDKSAARLGLTASTLAFAYGLFVVAWGLVHEKSVTVVSGGFCMTMAAVCGSTAWGLWDLSKHDRR